MIVTPYFYPKIGGLENYAFNIARGLQENHGHEVFVVTSNHKANEYIEEKIKGLRIIRLPIVFTVSNTPLNPQWYFQLRKIIKAEKPDIINAHSPVPGIADVTLKVANKIPTVLTYHAATLEKNGSIVFNIIAKTYALLEKVTFRKATAIIAVSDYVKAHLPKLYAKKTTIIYNAVNLSDIPNKKVSRKSYRLIFIASLDKPHSWKGLSEVLQAVKILAVTNKNIELLVLGDGDMMQAYKTQVESLDLVSHVQFKGYVTGDEKYLLLKSAGAIIVYPTTENDAFPTVILEAWACGTPVVAANIGALQSLIKNYETGVLAEPSKPKSLAKIVNNLIHDTDLQKHVSVTAQETVVANFSWEQSVNQTAKLFQNLLTHHMVKVGPQTKKKILIIAHMDSFANSKKPTLIEKALGDAGFETEITDTANISRAAKSGLLRNLPSFRPTKFALFSVQVTTLILHKLPVKLMRPINYHLIRVQMSLRATLNIKQAQNFDVVICETQIDSAVMLKLGTDVVKIYDCATPFADELYFGNQLTKKDYAKFKAFETSIFHAVDHLSFHWHSYTDYVTHHYNGIFDNLFQFDFMSETKTKKANFASRPRIVYMGYLGGYWADLQLLSNLTKEYPDIDVYGYPKPPKKYKLNYMGYANPDVLANYQFGLITISKDQLRCQGFSAKHLEYLSYGLPVLMPEWRTSCRDLEGTITYNPQDFVKTVKKYSTNHAWQTMSKKAYSQSKAYLPHRVIKPLLKLIEVEATN